MYFCSERNSSRRDGISSNSGGGDGNSVGVRYESADMMVEVVTKMTLGIVKDLHALFYLI